MKRTLIIGPGATGRTNKAEKIAAGYNEDNILVITGGVLTHVKKYQLPVMLGTILYQVPVTTELLIIDAIPEKHIKAVCEFFYNGSFRTELSGREPKYISPDILLTCKTHSNEAMFSPSFSRRYQVVISESNSPHTPLKFRGFDNDAPQYLN